MKTKSREIEVNLIQTFMGRLQSKDDWRTLN